MFDYPEDLQNVSLVEYLEIEFRIDIMWLYRMCKCYTTFRVFILDFFVKWRYLTYWLFTIFYSQGNGAFLILTCNDFNN